MKKNILRSISALAVVGLILSGCASSNDASSDTTAMDSTMTETQTMAGSTTTTTEAETNMNTENSTDVMYSDMFDNMENTETYDIMALARTNPNLSTFVSLAEKAGMEAALNNAGTDFTIFIPVNDAFKSLPKKDYDHLTNPANRADLIKVLQAHVLPNSIMTSQFQNNQRIQTADGKTINIAVTNTGGVTIGGARVVKPNVKVSNGTVHIIDAVIMPTE
jgi:uncharacterized surface protein with fasciclin (FAS1) repeats